MNKMSILVAVIFSLATLSFVTHALTDLGHGNPYEMSFQLAAAFFAGRIAYRKIVALRSGVHTATKI